ncbi:MAG: sigma factor [Pseudomonadota bacterium]
MQIQLTAQLAIEQLAEQLSGSSPKDAGDFDRKFADLMDLLAARVSRLIRQYHLSDLSEDAAQVAAIGVHRALATFDPAKARFSTYATWKIRGELQGLRHRMRLDQRRSAVSAGISTVSLDSLNMAGDDVGVFEIVDDNAQSCVESAASDRMAWACMSYLMDELDAPPNERAILYRYMFDQECVADSEDKTPEQRRQVVRRTMRNCAKLLAA